MLSFPDTTMALEISETFADYPDSFYESPVSSNMSSATASAIPLLMPVTSAMKKSGKAKKNVKFLLNGVQVRNNDRSIDEGDGTPVDAYR